MICPETRSWGMVNIGLFCHEFGHILGLPDLYDIDESNGASEGIGVWGLMGGGSWLNQEKTPANMCAWSRINCGWISPIPISVGTFTMHSPLNTSVVYKILTNQANEYFLLENRQNVGQDQYLPGEGLAIWHVDDNQSENDDENHKLVDLEEADGLNDLDNGMNSGDAGDLYPGSSNATFFNELSNPNSNLYSGLPSNIDINNITEDDLIITFSINSPAFPDLVPVSAGFYPQEGGIGTDLKVYATIKNIGQVKAAASTLLFCLYNDSVDCSDHIIGTPEIIELNAGDSSSIEIIYEVPASLPVAQYYIGFTVDYNNDVVESDEGNTYCLPWSPFTRLPDPDLAVSFMEFSPDTAKPGNELSVNIVLENIDLGSSGSGIVKYYLSDDTLISDTDFVIGTSTFSNLNGGQELALGISWTVVSSLPDGDYYVGCIVDANNIINESNEENNVFYLFPNRFSKNDPPATLIIETLSENNNKDYLIYPNPTTGKVNIQFFNAGTTHTIQLINSSGQILDERRNDSPHEIIDLNNVSKGTYFLKVSSVKSSRIDKIILK
jgi:hypothetical protein